MECLHVSLVLLALLCSSVEFRIRKQRWIIDDDICQTPDKEVGVCKRIYKCQSMTNFLASKSEFTQKEKNALSSYRCGVYKNEPKVCCPGNSISLEWAYGNETSTTPGNGKGTCVSLAACNIIYDFIKKNDDFSDQTKDALRKYICSADTSNGVKVFCPKELPQEFEQAQAPADDSHHKNYKLLPKVCGLSATSVKITNGNQSDLFEFPWAAALKYDKKYNPYSCGGSLINDRYVLTAAHCIDPSNSLIGVRLGEYNFKTDPDCNDSGDVEDCAESPQDFEIDSSDAIIHPQYDRNTLHNDIALIRLRRPANTTVWSVMPICLPITVAEKTKLFSNYTVIGWGITEANVSSPILMKVLLPRVEIPNCSLKYVGKFKKKLTNEQICAGGKHKQDSCIGDSGGPLSAEYANNGAFKVIQYGIVSFGPTPCGINDFPGVYIRVDKYTKWILDNLKP